MNYRAGEAIVGRTSLTNQQTESINSALLCLSITSICVTGTVRSKSDQQQLNRDLQPPPNTAHTQTDAHTCKQTRTRMCAHANRHGHRHTHGRIRIHMQTDANMQTHTRRHTHTHTNRHAHGHTHGHIQPQDQYVNMWLL